MIQPLVPPGRLEQPIDREPKVPDDFEGDYLGQFESDGFTPAIVSQS
jgi:hypothetical protein